MTWPTDRPGYPMHAERDGWHWLRTPDDQTAPYEWRTAGECERGRWPSHWVSGVDEWKGTDCAYLGPCYTQADLDAAVQAEREACADVAYGIYDDRMTVGEEETAQGAYDAAVSIQARGPTSALDAAKDARHGE